MLEDAIGMATVSTSRADAVEGSDVDIEHHSSGIGFHGSVDPSLLPTPDRADLGLAEPTDDGRLRTVAVAVLVAAAVGAGILIGRRSRRRTDESDRPMEPAVSAGPAGAAPKGLRSHRWRAAACRPKPNRRPKPQTS